MRLAIVAPVRRTSVPSFLAHSSSESVQDVRRGPRPRNAGSHGDVAQRSSRRWTATGSRAPVGFTANEDGRFRPSFGSQNFPSCFLGVMGRLSLHDSDSSSRDRGRSDKTDGCERGHRLSRRVARVHPGPRSERVCRTTTVG